MTAAGWVGFLFTYKDPVLSAIAGQVANLAAGIPFVELQYKHPHQITKIGQGLYIMSVTLNLLAMNSWSLSKENISPIGFAFCTALCTAGLIAGYVREWWEAKKSCRYNLAKKHHFPSSLKKAK